jgi:hypothetical protein
MLKDKIKKKSIKNKDIKKSRDNSG